MKTLNLVQGSQEWLDVRLSHFTASEAPVMMGKSKYQKRDDLLQLKKTGVQKEVSDFTQRLFDRGHESEEMARPLAESIVGDELYSSTGSAEIYGQSLLASFDGITMDGTIIWEHKLWNEKLAQSMEDGKIEQHYLWQIAQQLLVSGADKCLFMTSDGTEDNQAWCWVRPSGIFDKKSLPLDAMIGLGGLGEKWEIELLEGWNNFKDDLEDYELPETAEADDLLQELLSAYSVQKEIADIEIAKIKALESEIKKAAKQTGAKNIVSNGFKIDLVERKGSIDYGKIPELQKVNLDEYRKPSTTYYQIKQTKREHS